MKRIRLIPLYPEKGEEHCADCGGTGTEGFLNGRKCKRCKGTGRLDWVEIIIGKDNVVHIPENLKERSRLNRQKKMGIVDGSN